MLLVGEKKDRIKFMMENYGLSEKRAKMEVEEGDRRRANLYAMFAKSGNDDPMLYSLSINTSRTDLDKAVELVCSLVKP